MNVHSFPGVRSYSAAPNESLIKALRDLLARAEAGELRSMVATGFMADGTRMTCWGALPDNVYEMLGAIAWLQAEYVHRHTGELS